MTETRIEQLHAYQIFDSRGNPTVEVEAVLAGGARPRARSVGRIHRPIRSLGVAGRRPAAVSRQVRVAGRGQRRTGNRGGPTRIRCTRPAGTRPASDRTRRHPEQEPFGRQCHPGRFHGRSIRGRGRVGQTVVRLLGPRRRHAAAAARNPDCRRRRARQLAD